MCYEGGSGSEGDESENGAEKENRRNEKGGIIIDGRTLKEETCDCASILRCLACM